MRSIKLPFNCFRIFPIGCKSAVSFSINYHLLNTHVLEQMPINDITVGYLCMVLSKPQSGNKQRFLTPGHQGWNDLHSLCRICMEYYLLNNDDNNIIYWIMMIMMMIIMMIIMMTMMIIGTATIMIIIITTTLTTTKMIMIKTAQTPCQSLYKDRRI